MVNVLSKISFCLTDEDLQTVEETRRRIAMGGRNSNRSEILRAAIAQLSRLSDTELLDAVALMPRLPPGRRPGKP
jgi:hypothetical protein